LSDVEYISYTTDEDTNPDGRARAFKVLAHFHDIRYNGGSDICQCYLAGLMFGWLIGGSIGIKDAEDLRDAFALLPPTDDIFKGVPFGHRDVSPDVLSLKQGKTISNLEYDRLRAMLPAVEDTFTPPVAAVS